MKRVYLLLASAMCLIVGCKQENKEFTTFHMEDSVCLFHSDGPDDEWPLYLKNSYSVEWPAEGLLSAEALRELMIRCFDDSTAADVEQAAQRWLNTLWPTDAEITLKGEVIDAIPDTVMHSEAHLESYCMQDSTLATFVIKDEYYWAGAAHGVYGVDYLTIDKATGNVVHLTDLVVDTNLLCEAVAHAIQDLEVNKDILECLFDEYRDVERMPMPQTFLVDSARNSIIVLYGIYAITPYCCGIQSVVMPIFWLSKHVPLTLYAKRLFGPGCSID